MDRRKKQKPPRQNLPGRLVIINRDRNYYILLCHIIPHILVSVKRKSVCGGLIALPMHPSRKRSEAFEAMPPCHRVSLGRIIGLGIPCYTFRDGWYRLLFLADQFRINYSPLRGFSRFCSESRLNLRKGENLPKQLPFEKHGRKWTNGQMEKLMLYFP